MKKTNLGFTLIEVIVALALLAIISTGILGALVGHYRLLSYTKTLTENAFLAQEDVEKDIEIAKALLSDEDEATNPTGKVDYTYFHRLDGSAITVSGFPLKTLGDFNIHTIVSETRTPAFKVPTITAVNMDLYEDSSQLTKNYEYEALADLNLKALATEDRNGVFLTNQHEWFVSRFGFNIPIISAENIDKDFDYGRLYPLFPNDYIAVPIKVETDSSVESTLSALETDYAGRHIIYAITPYATSGKRGDTYFSQPVFLSGLPVIDDLILHLDASLISKEDTSSVVSSGDDLYIQKWIDVSGHSNNLIQTSIANRPELNEVQYQEDVYSWGKSTNTTKTDISMLCNHGIYAEQDTYSFVIVVKSGADEATPGTHIMRGGDLTDANRWQFGWVADTIDPTKSNLAFSVGSSSVVIPNQLGLDGEWHIFTGLALGNKLHLRMDGVDIVPLGVDFSVKANMDNLDIMWNNSGNNSMTEIAEVLIYNNDISDSGTDMTDIELYLSNKYNPDPATFQMYILNLVPISTKTVVMNTTFVMPTTVAANMSNGTQMNIPVNWATNIDTTTTGFKTSVGTAILGNTRTITLNVNVVEIDSIIPLDQLEINELEDYPLPTELPAVLIIDGSTYDGNVEVSWSPSSTIGLGIGFHIFTATSVDDPTKVVTMTIKVIEAEFDIVYDANNGDGLMADRNENYGVSFSLDINTFTRDGYDFAGWGTSASGPIVYSDGQTITMPEGGLELYAIWDVKPIQVVSITGDNSEVTILFNQKLDTAEDVEFYNSGWGNLSTERYTVTGVGTNTITITRDLYAFNSSYDYRIGVGAGGSITEYIEFFPID